jgi:hypothetical protein
VFCVAHAKPRKNHSASISWPRAASSGERDGEEQIDALDHVAMPEVSEFVCQHGFDLAGLQAAEQGVEKDDALASCQSR